MSEEELRQQEYEIAFAEGESYALNSLLTEWEKYKDNYGNDVIAIPHYYVERLAKRLTGKYKMLRKNSMNNERK